MKMINKAIQLETESGNTLSNNADAIIDTMCPSDYGFEKKEDNKICRNNFKPNKCTACWNREYVEQEGEKC